MHCLKPKVNGVETVADLAVVTSWYARTKRRVLNNAQVVSQVIVLKAMLKTGPLNAGFKHCRW